MFAEYCIDEYFNPKCQDNELILMQSALYGRMSNGRCLPSDKRNLGCQANVLNVLDDTCSGQSKCNVPVVDPRITAKNGCLKGYLTYLQAEYTCVPGISI